MLRNNVLLGIYDAYDYFRAITKMLGDWWANLDSKTKECYKDLAVQVIQIYKSSNFTFEVFLKLNHIISEQGCTLQC